MKLTHEDYEHMTVMTLRWYLAADGAEEFRSAAAARFTAQVRDFVLELSGVEFIDSKGLEAILWLQDQAGERLGQIRIAAAQENVRKIFEITRLAPRLDCHGDVDSAIKSLR